MYCKLNVMRKKPLLCHREPEVDVYKRQSIDTLTLKYYFEIVVVEGY